MKSIPWINMLFRPFRELQKKKNFEIPFYPKPAKKILCLRCHKKAFLKVEMMVYECRDCGWNLAEESYRYNHAQYAKLLNITLKL